MEFEEYLELQLEKPVADWYDPDGNSERAKVVRGVMKEIAWQYRYYPKLFKSLLSDYDGLETPVGWFVLVPFFTLFAPVIPIIRGVELHKGALDSYRRQWEREVKNNG